MAADALTLASVLKCPHNGTVLIVTTNARVFAAAPLLTAADSFTVLGCQAGQCVSVRWDVPDVRTRVNGVATLSRSSLGTCLNSNGIPQGPVVVSITQPLAKTS